MAEAQFYLCFQKRQRGYRSLRVRVTERQPALNVGEVAIRVSAVLPDILFQRPLLTAKISVPLDKCSPATIDASVADNITDIVRQELGVDMRLVIEQHPAVSIEATPSTAHGTQAEQAKVGEAQ